MYSLAMGDEPLLKPPFSVSYSFYAETIRESFLWKTGRD
jgi:hypothetical protein